MCRIIDPLGKDFFFKNREDVLFSTKKRFGRELLLENIEELPNVIKAKIIALTCVKSALKMKNWVNDFERI
jgi:hypothetical protein